MANSGKVILGTAANAAADAARDAASAVSSVTRKVGDKAEVARIASEIAKAQKKIEGLFTNIGRIQYEAHCGVDVDQGCSDLFAEIDACNDEINALRHRSADLRGLRICPTCNRECQKDDIFCAKCGTRLISEEDAKNI